jgi:hypothetical protein
VRKNSGSKRPRSPEAISDAAAETDLEKEGALSSIQPRARELSGPDIKIVYAPAGRDTLSTVARELARAAEAAAEHPEALPTLELGALIEPRPIDAVDADSDAETRRYVTTKGYGDRKAPPALPALRPARLIAASAPEITVSHAPAGRETLAAINEELCEEPSTGVRATLRSEVDVEDPSPALAPLDIFEMLTFVVRGSTVEDLSSPEARKRLVLTRLRHRLPIQDEAEIDRIDVTPWNVRGMVVVRVWCRVTDRAR